MLGEIKTASRLEKELDEKVMKNHRIRTRRVSPSRGMSPVTQTSVQPGDGSGFDRAVKMLYNSDIVEEDVDKDTKYLEHSKMRVYALNPLAGANIVKSKNVAKVEASIDRRTVKVEKVPIIKQQKIKLMEKNEKAAEIDRELSRLGQYINKKKWNRLYEQ